MNENVTDSLDLDFKIVFKGYSVPEVNEYIAQLRSEIEDIRAENGELYRKIEFYTTEMENHREDEETRKQLILQAQEEAEEIIKEAKKQAAKEVLRGNRLCSRMVADMVSQVEEQKKLFIATKTEAANFRRELFERYRVHIGLINAMSEATGVFDGNEITDTELEDLKNMMESTELSDDPEKPVADAEVLTSTEDKTSLFMDAFSDTASFGAVAAPLTNKKGKNKRSVLKPQEKKMAEKPSADGEKKGEASAKEGAKSISQMRNETIYGEDLFEEFSVPTDEPQAEPLPEAEEISAVISEIEKQPEAKPEAKAEVKSEEKTAEQSAPKAEKHAEKFAVKLAKKPAAQKAEEIPAMAPRKDEGEESLFEEDYAVGARNDAFVMTEEDLEEFGNPDGAVMEYDSPVSVDSVFKNNPYNDADFDFLYGEEETSEAKPEEPRINRITPATVSENVERKFNSYGFDVSSVDRNDPDDDSDEFYMEDDDEFDPAAKEGVPTGTVSSFGISAPKSSTERRRRVRRNKSLTDEFDVVRAEEE